MRDIVLYRAIRANNTKDLEFLVQDLLKIDGYQPLGPPIVSVMNNKREYVQVLVARQPEPRRC